ncbi:MAG: signal peptide peptidase SppA, partial [Alphaproteobacteria bacterium]
MKAFFKFLWGAIKAFHTIAASILLLFIFIILAGVLAEKPGITVPDGAALLFAPKGMLVEKQREPTLEDLMDGAPIADETVLREAVRALEAARDDARIKALVLDPDDLAGGGPAALHALGRAIEDFKASGKPVFAIGDSYSQAQYLLAAHADKLWMNPMGSVSLTGYGVYVPHFASALKKLKAKVHVFRVGTYKSAVEPFIRDDMSPAAKEANRAFLTLLWRHYVDEVTRLRGLEEGAIDRAIAEMVPRLKAAGGDEAKLALAEGWVDELRTRREMAQGVAEIVGADAAHGFRQIAYTDYLKTLKTKNADAPAIAVIPLRGAI